LSVLSVFIVSTVKGQRSHVYAVVHIIFAHHVCVKYVSLNKSYHQFWW